MRFKTDLLAFSINVLKYIGYRSAKIIIICAAFATISSIAWAADIKRVEGSNSPAIIMITGAIKIGDADQFAAVAASISSAVITMASPGGSLIEGLRIGQMIRNRGFATLVPDGATCASACAFAWLGGYKRFLQPQGQIGFHAAYTIQDGKAVESGVGNALAGAYLAQLGLGPEAIVYITLAHPKEITWLSEHDAKQVGIELAVLPSIKPSTRDASSPQPIRRAVSEVAGSFPGTYFAHWSERGVDTISYFATLYANKVSFYGADVTADLVLAQKRKFAKRYPVRVYSVRPKSVSVQCEGVSCILTGVVNWDVRSSDGSEWSHGAANFSLGVRVAGEAVTIVSESGSVIERDANLPTAEAR